MRYRPPPSVPPFPGTVCASVNEQVVHGIPLRRKLRGRDAVGIDIGAVLGGSGMLGPSFRSWRSSTGTGWCGNSGGTPDGGLSAQYEHTVAVTADGCDILTPWHRHTNESAASA